MHHAVAVISGDLYSTLHTAGIFCFTCIAIYTPHPFQGFSCRLSDPVHTTAAKWEPRSPAGKTQSLPGFFHHRTGRNGLHTLTCTVWWDEKEKIEGESHTFIWYFWSEQEKENASNRKRTYRAKREQAAGHWLSSSSWSWRWNFWCSTQSKMPVSRTEVHCTDCRFASEYQVGGVSNGPSVCYSFI